ncbi:MAG: LysR family transcriptional regulator [Burkholderiales bacterium]
MNWDDLRYFLELARQKRLTHAGHKLAVDHTTVARRVEHLEQTLGCRLFEPGVDGYALTDTGRGLFAHAESIEGSIALLHEEATGQSVRVSGVVRVGAPEGFGTVFLVPRLGALLDEHPDLEVELLTLPRFPSLAAREADLNVTLDPPSAGRYIATRLTDFGYGLYASRGYLAQHGPIGSTAELAGHRFAGYIDELLLSPQLNYLDEIAPRPRVTIACSGMLAQQEAVRAGLCIGVLAHYLARGPDLVRILPAEVAWTRTFWLATHADWHRLRRIRVVWDFLRRSVEEAPGFFAPPVADAGGAARAEL